MFICDFVLGRFGKNATSDYLVGCVYSVVARRYPEEIRVILTRSRTRDLRLPGRFSLFDDDSQILGKKNLSYRNLELKLKRLVEDIEPGSDDNFLKILCT